jgi:hypothetical protein
MAGSDLGSGTAFRREGRIKEWRRLEAPAHRGAQSRMADLNDDLLNLLFL